MKQFLTLTVWWAVPVIWLPVVVWCISMSVSMGCSFPEIVSLVALGIFIWTFIEYCLHRFLFHMKTKSYWFVTHTHTHFLSLCVTFIYLAVTMNPLQLDANVIVEPFSGETRHTILFTDTITSTQWTTFDSSFLLP